MKIEIDPKSGFCYGVVKAIEKAEHHAKMDHPFYCLGEIVHNSEEVNRLQNIGAKTILWEEISKKKNLKILFRAHGEPPESYNKLKECGIEIVDATCPVVLKLQDRIRKAYKKMIPVNGQVVVFGKKGHPEVTGLIGQVNGDAIVIESIKDIDSIDLTRPIELFAQTTKDVDQFNLISEKIRYSHHKPEHFSSHDTICRQVSNRIPNLKSFAKKYDTIIFVGGANSSNAKVLFGVCNYANDNSHFITKADEVDFSWFKNSKSIGICGATSTPMWQLEQVYKLLTENF